MVYLLVFLAYALVLSIALAFAGYRSSRTTQVRHSGKPPQKILIIGATGGTGRQLISQALARGYAVTALVRKPSRLAIEHPQLTILQGDVLEPDTIDAAMRGQDAVVSALGHKRYLGPSRILSEGTRNILEAMQAQHVPRFVCETSLGIGDSAGRMGLYYTFFTIPVILPFYFWDKTRQERLIAASDIDWVIVRPAILNNGAKRGRCRSGHRIGNFIWGARISRADVADFMLDQLVDNTYLRQAPGLSW